MLNLFIKIPIIIIKTVLKLCELQFFKRMKKILLISFLLINILALGQTKEELERRKRQNYKDIKFTNELLKQTKQKRDVSYNRLLLISSKINTRKELINNINSEIELINYKLKVNQDILIELNDDLKKLKNEYARMIYYSYLQKNAYNKLMFILAAEDFNMAFRRLKYFQQYSQHRKKQAELIVKTKNEIKTQVELLEIMKAEKSSLILDKQVENKALFAEKTEQDKSLKKIKIEEKKLRKKLKKQYRVAQNLQKEIERIIEEEARKAAARLKNSSAGFFKLTPEEKLIATNIEKNKKHLPWPTKRGIITGSFGEHPHPIIKGVKIKNDGIDIATNTGAIARSIFDGTVSRIITVPGAHKTIIIRHGNYLTVYSNLKEVIVRQGDKVKTKQTIGVIYTDKINENKTVLQFQIWKENKKLNPEYWLAKNKND